MAYFRNKLKSELNTATNIPAPVDIPPEMLSDEDHLDRELEPQPEAPQPAPQPQPEATPEGDEGTALLRQHIASAKRAEEIQHQRQAMAAAENRRAAWLQATPSAMQHYSALAPLHQQAMQLGLDDLSPEYFRHLESGLAAIAQTQEQPVEEQPTPEPEPERNVQEPTPEFFRPKRVSMPAPRSTAAMVSAPVSRSIPSADRDRIETNPNSVRLTPAQREAAKIAGISELEYARGMVAIDREKREGRRQP